MNQTSAAVVGQLGVWLGKPVSMWISIAGSPTAFSTDGTLMHDQSLPEDAIAGWYVDVKAHHDDDIGFGTIDLGLDKYPICEVREREGGYPPQLYASGAGPLTITIDPITEEPG